MIMQLSPLYLEKIQAAERIGEARGEARSEARANVEGETGLIVWLLTRRFGSIDINVTAQIQQLSLAQLDDLGAALLDFTSLADLMGWLSRN